MLANNAENEEDCQNNEDANFEDVHIIGATEAEPEVVPANPPPHFPAGYLEDEGDDVLDAEELYAYGILTPPPSPPFFGFDADDDEDPWQPEEHIPLVEVVPENGLNMGPAEFALQQLSEYLEFLEFLEGEENGGPGLPQALVPAASGSLGPPLEDDDDLGEVE